LMMSAAPAAAPPEDVSQDPQASHIFVFVFVFHD